MPRANNFHLPYTLLAVSLTLFIISCTNDIESSTNFPKTNIEDLPPGKLVIQDDGDNPDEGIVVFFGGTDEVSPNKTKTPEEREAFLKKKFKSLLVFHADDTMIVDQPKLATLVLAKNESVQHVKMEVLDETDINDQEISDTAMDIGNKMKAKLISFESSGDEKAMEIEALGESEQSFAGKRDKVIWQWKITPKKKGQQILKLSVQVLEKDGESVTLPAKDIKVNIYARKTNLWSSIAAFLNKKWEFLLTAIMVPLLIAFFTTRMKNKSTKPSDSFAEKDKKSEAPVGKDA